MGESVLTMGSLFDGIGGFPLAAARNDIIPVWASEIEPFPIRITKKHFPDRRYRQGCAVGAVALLLMLAFPKFFCWSW